MRGSHRETPPVTAAGVGDGDGDEYAGGSRSWGGSDPPLADDAPGPARRDAPPTATRPVAVTGGAGPGRCAPPPSRPGACARLALAAILSVRAALRRLQVRAAPAPLAPAVAMSGLPMGAWSPPRPLPGILQRRLASPQDSAVGPIARPRALPAAAAAAWPPLPSLQAAAQAARFPSSPGSWSLPCPRPRVPFGSARPFPEALRLQRGPLLPSPQRWPCRLPSPAPAAASRQWLELPNPRDRELDLPCRPLAAPLPSSSPVNLVRRPDAALARRSRVRAGHRWRAAAALGGEGLVEVVCFLGTEREALTCPVSSGLRDRVPAVGETGLTGLETAKPQCRVLGHFGVSLVGRGVPYAD